MKISLKSLKGVIFDLDGVLIDSEYYQSQAWIEALKNYKVFLKVNDLLKYKGKSAEIIEKELKEKYNLNLKEGELVRARNQQVLKIFRQKKKIKLMGYAKEALKFFSQKDKKLALASTGSKEEVLLKLKKAKLLKYFPVIVSRDEVKRGKPFPDIYLLAVKKLNLKPENCLALEDTQSGVEAAKSAGLFCFAIPAKFSEKQDFQKADKIFKNLKEVIRYFKNEKKMKS